MAKTMSDLSLKCFNMYSRIWFSVVLLYSNLNISHGIYFAFIFAWSYFMVVVSKFKVDIQVGVHTSFLQPPVFMIML